MELREETQAAVSLPVSWPDTKRVLAVPMPIAFGVALPYRRMREPCRCRLDLPNAVSLLGQTTVLGRWADGSVRWLLIDAVIPAEVELTGIWQAILEPGHDRPPINGIVAALDGESIVVTNERMRLRFNRRGSFQARARTPGEDGDRSQRTRVQGGRSSIIAQLPQLTDAKGRVHAPQVTALQIAAAGPVRATVEIEATYPRVRGLRLRARWSFYKDSNLATADITVHNPHRALHRGGLWDLGDPGSVLFRDLSVPICLAGDQPATVRVRCEPGQLWQEGGAGGVEIYQDSSGCPHWDSANHVNRDGVVPLRFSGYRGRAGNEMLAGQRAAPTVEIAAGGERLVATIAEFWQQYPKAIATNGTQLSLRLFPCQFGDLHELQGGEQKTHRIELQLALGTDVAHEQAGSSGAAAEQCLENGFLADESLPIALPQRQALSLSAETTIPGLPNWDQGDPAVLARLDELAEEFLTGRRGVYANRERVDDYGWRNYGDLHADHEELHYHGPQPLVSHYNNQFDVLCGLLLQYLRTADSRWMELADPLARHVIDIDIYHTTEDRPAYCGGLFWFTDHYLHAHTSTHRTYSRHNHPAERNSYGGGPSSEHNFTTGLLLYHLLTGNRLAREAVQSLANWVLAMDDGRQTVFGTVDDGPTGLATLPQAPGRGAGNSINALLDAWLLVGERRYLDYAELLIRRCIHPREDIAARDLLNAEKRWSYTVFLVSLDKYLRCKAEATEFDAMYAYAQESLLHYGRWMLDHERPYFDRRGQLEYPTEAWPAQELRKANAMRLAAGYAGPAERTRMFDRGDELAEQAWNDLLQFPTRTTARAMAIVLTEGLRDAELRRRDDRAPPRASLSAEYPSPEAFLPQRERIKEKLRSPKGIAALLVSAARPGRWPRFLNHR